jgi:hypothetical protein
MAHVLEYVNYEVQPTEEAFLIKPIRKLYNSDRTKTKDKFMTALSVIYFYADPRSTYNYIIDDEARLKAIIEQEGLPSDFKITGDIAEAIECYKTHCITTSYELLEASKAAAHKVSEFLRNVNLYDTNDKGMPKYTVNNITMALKQVPQLVKELKAQEELLAKEIEESGNARGGNASKSLMDDGVLL